MLGDLGAGGSIRVHERGLGGKKKEVCKIESEGVVEWRREWIKWSK